ncbi:MAG TPA: protein translocase subunit SecF [Marmoricola sp.]|nr:protein translocase subunit SecF [Nocardioidaceae bacterium]MCB8992656.1 protein translocase subunit SecF [Nocardioidaceae bacterium]MCO5324308.1 protein translocase subunit SecF [Nocardioidaceae bacterium]HRV68757.1 protein translocase subunit SecF [Marmoricola sp.]
MGKFSRLGNDLYEGNVSVDFVHRPWRWYALSGIFIVLAFTGLFFRGLNLGVEFQGGTEMKIDVPSSMVNQKTVDEVRTAVAGAGVTGAESPIVNTSGSQGLLVRTEQLSNKEAVKVAEVIAEVTNVDPKTKISTNDVGASWGKQVADRAIQGLIVFVVGVILFIWAYFREWKFSAGAIVALFHDILITVGIYALSGFEVTPATVTGFLTILGFSLYDTVVVFDKVRENTKDMRSSRRSYADLANLAVNQTLVRSINTSIVALLPVAAILYVGVTTLGSGSLKDLALALFIGMATGAYSSIFIAPSVLVQLKSREKEVSEQDRRAKARAKRDADRYANVPAFAEGMPVGEAAAGEPVEEGMEARISQPQSRPSQSGRPVAGAGREVPEPKRPVEESKSANRNQPTKQPRSKRNK